METNTETLIRVLEELKNIEALQRDKAQQLALRYLDIEDDADKAAAKAHVSTADELKKLITSISIALTTHN